MYGEWVTVKLGDGIECRVWVSCVPSTPDYVLQQKAISILKSRLPEKKTGLAALSDSLQAISDYEYSQGRGHRYEAEQELKQWIKGLLK